MSNAEGINRRSVNRGTEYPVMVIANLYSTTSMETRPRRSRLNAMKPRLNRMVEI